MERLVGTRGRQSPSKALAQGCSGIPIQSPHPATTNTHQVNTMAVKPQRPDLDPVSGRRLPYYLSGLASLTEWHQQAGCRGLDTEIFFPTTKGENSQAQAICASCPVTHACRSHAESMPEAFGIWGGRTARERGYDSRGKRTAGAAEQPC
ncbi:WhiB family transcriptional regulator [Streptomyces sp. NPDC051909]|uniref:WhiB family transcriptional regulator n=1 Tax=Streptomyces sp. NPDC051909 TaxID=3154944 RepID=UPI00341A5C02